MHYVTLPEHFVAVKYPGYFYHLIEKKLYSLKMTGMLYPLKYSRPCKWNEYKGGYRVSVNGIRRLISDEYLCKVTARHSIIPVKGELSK